MSKSVLLSSKNAALVLWPRVVRNWVMLRISLGMSTTWDPSVIPQFLPPGPLAPPTTLESCRPGRSSRRRRPPPPSPSCCQRGTPPPPSSCRRNRRSALLAEISSWQRVLVRLLQSPTWPHTPAPKGKIIPEKTKRENTCFLSCGSMEPSLPHSSSPPFVETSFKPSLQIFPTHKLHIQCGLTCISQPPIRPLLDGRSSHQSTLPSDQSSGQGKEIEPAKKENYKNWWITDAEIICQCWSRWYPSLLLNSYQSQFHQCYLPFILKSSFHNSSSEILTHEVLIKCCWILVVGIWNKSGIKLAHKCCSSSHTYIPI